MSEHTYKRSHAHRFTTVAVLIGLIMLASAVPANAAHFLGYDSVDNGEIRYEDNSSYAPDVAYSIAGWNDLGCISLLPDGITTIEDLEISSNYYGATGWDGKWTLRSGSDLIRINRSYTDSYSTNKRRGVIGHEIGHGLGIGDHGPAYAGILMVGNTPDRGNTHLAKPHDISDYNQLWC